MGDSKYAISGSSFRAVTSDMQLADGETLINEIPHDLLNPLPADVVREQITLWLDRVVRAKGYDSIVSCASYATSSDATFRAEAQAAIAWRDAVYRRGYELFAGLPYAFDAPDQAVGLLPEGGDFGWAA